MLYCVQIVRLCICDLCCTVYRLCVCVFVTCVVLCTDCAFVYLSLFPHPIVFVTHLRIHGICVCVCVCVCMYVRGVLISP